MIERKQNKQDLSEDAHFRLMRLLEGEPQLSQRELAERMGVSVGKVNYCMRALIEKGWLKAGNFVRSDNKSAYLYLLTPHGVKAKAAMTLRFLRRKEQEHQALLEEIAALRKETQKDVRTLSEDAS
jgi:MarR family transcriptional regulator, temperature-dependent positive regulator of motility